MMMNKVTNINRNVNCPQGRKECGIWPKAPKWEENMGLLAGFAPASLMNLSKVIYTFSAPF